MFIYFVKIFFQDLKTLCNDETYSETNEAMNLEEKNNDGIPVL